MRTILKNKKGVFGLTAVQSFFAIILGIALLAYIIVIIMGVLNTNAILGGLAGSSVTNESVSILVASGQGVGLSAYQYPTCVASVTQVTNDTTVLNANNYSVSGCVLTPTNKTSYGNTWKVTYSYTTSTGNAENNVLGNTSSGITSFFGSIQPVYAILAILVIILVLVVLVRVVQPQGAREGTPSL